MKNSNGTAAGITAAVLLSVGLVVFLIAFTPCYLRWRAEQRATGTKARIPPNLTASPSPWLRKIRSYGRTKVSDPEPAMLLHEGPILRSRRPLPKIYPDDDGKFRVRNLYQVSRTRASPPSVHPIAEEGEADTQYPPKQIVRCQHGGDTIARKPLPRAPSPSPYLTKPLPALPNRTPDPRLNTHKLRALRTRPISGSRFTEQLSPVSPMFDVDLSR